MHRNVVRALLIVTIAATFVASRRGARAEVTQPVTVVFIAGLCPWPHADPYCIRRVNAAARGVATFAAVLTAMDEAHISYRALHYSYDPRDPASYAVTDTHATLARSAAVLDRIVRRALAGAPDRKVDLVAYSLGGVVAAEWAATLGRRERLLGHVRSIVTMDSPVRGVHALLPASVLVRVFSGNVWADLQPRSRAIRQITAFHDAWWRRSAHLHSLANRADRLVPPSDALLGDRHTVSDTVCPADFAFLHSCHGAILNDAAASRLIACSWIAPDNPCAPRPTATPTRTPLPTATSTATPTPTTAPTATATATATPTPTPTSTPSPTPTATPLLPLP